MATDENSPLLGDTQNEEDEVELRGCGATAACDPRRPVHRYLVLIIMCFLSFGSYFCYDNPAALQDTMKKSLDITTEQFMSFYAWYSWPNVILCFFGGFLIDRFLGVRMGAIVFSLFVTAGQFVFGLGAFLKNVILMDVGRFIFGIGGESLCVAQNTYAVSWFKGKELNMVFGLQLSFSRVGSTVNMNVMQPLYDAVASRVPEMHTALGISLFIAGGFCVFSLICALAMAFFDKRAKRILKTEDAKTGDVVRITDVKDFSASLWLLCVICVGYYVAIFPFIGLGMVFFEMKFNYTPSQADSVNSLVYIISAVASPVFGFCIDKTGKNIFWVLTGIIVTMGCHGLLAFTFVNPYVAMKTITDLLAANYVHRLCRDQWVANGVACWGCEVTMGLAYSILASALWPQVAMVVPERQLGTAYGIMQAIQNLGLAVISIVAGKLVDSSGYLVLEVFFLACLCVSLVGTVGLYLLDAARGGVLNRSAGERKRLAALEESTSHISDERASINS